MVGVGGHEGGDGLSLRRRVEVRLERLGVPPDLLGRDRLLGGDLVLAFVAVEDGEVLGRQVGHQLDARAESLSSDRTGASTSPTRSMRSLSSAMRVAARALARPTG